MANNGSTPRTAFGSPASEGRPAALKRGDLQERVQKVIRHGLMSGGFLPGQVLSLRKIADKLGTSPMPVREALSQLLAINVLETQENRSVRVPRLTPERIEELIMVRVANEGLAARLACKTQPADLLDKLSRINDDLLKAIETRDLHACLKQNIAFHFSLYSAAQANSLMPIIESLWLQSGPTMYLTLLTPKVPWDAAAHIEVLEGMRRKDPDMVERAIGADIRRSASHLETGTNLHNVPLEMWSV